MRSKSWRRSMNGRVGWSVALFRRTECGGGWRSAGSLGRYCDARLAVCPGVVETREWFVPVDPVGHGWRNWLLPSGWQLTIYSTWPATSRMRLVQFMLAKLAPETAPAPRSRGSDRASQKHPQHFSNARLCTMPRLPLAGMPPL